MAFEEFKGKLDEPAGTGFVPFSGKLDAPARGTGRSLSDAALDTGITLLKGAIGLPEAFVGLADIPTMGRVGKFLEDYGFKPREAKEILDTYLSEAQQTANRKVREAKGFLPTIQAALENPSTIATAVGESLPQMLGGAAIARTILKAAPTVAPFIAGAVGEGTLGAGSAAEQIRGTTEDKLLTPKQAVAAAGSGAGTALFGAVGGRLAQKFGFADIDTLLASGATGGKSKSVADFTKKVLGSGISEGVFEEMPQSAQETMWMNYATDKPLLEGVPEAAGMGAVTGFTMGVAGGATSAALQRKPAAPTVAAPPPGNAPPAGEPSFTAAPVPVTPEPGGRVEPQLEGAPAVVPPVVEPVPGMMQDEDLAQPDNVSVTPVTVTEPEVTPVTPVEPPVPAAPPASPVIVPPPTKAAESLPETPTVPPATTPKLFEPAPGEHQAQDMTVVAVPVKDLTLSKDVPQFKSGASSTGVVEPLSGKFTQEGVAPIAVWRRLDGSLEVISGRHRLDLAKRSGTELINAQVYDEAQGFDKAKASILDAELNIRDEQGKVKDYVNYFKASGTDRETADAKGFLARTKGKRGFTIANQGSDALIAAINSDQIGDEAAYYVAINAPNDERLQGVGLKALMDGKSIQAATNMMQALKAIAAETDTTTDMFGDDDSLIKEAEEMAKIASKMQQSVQNRLSAITGAAKNPAMAKAEGIDVRDPDAIKRRIEELRVQKAALENWSTNPDLVAQIRAARGTPAPKVEPLDLKSPTIQDIIDQEELRKKSETLNEQEQIRKESEAGSEQFKLEQEEGRQDSTSSLFDEEKPQTVAISPEEERKEALEQLKRQLLNPVLPFQALRVGKTQILRPSPLTDAQVKEILKLASDAIDLGMPAAVLGNINAAGSTRMKSVGVMSANGDFMIGSQWKEASPAEKLQTLIHELGHSIDFLANRISGQADWSKANTELKNWYDASANKFKHPVAYPFAPQFKARVNLKNESFAQAFGYYFTSPVDLQKNAPEAYSQIQSIVERIQNGSQKARAAGTTERGTAAIKIQPSRAEENTAVQPGASTVGTPISATERLKDTGAGKPVVRTNFFREALPDLGFKRLGRGDPMAYRDKGGKEFPTYERDGVRVAFSSNELLFEDERGRVNAGMSEGDIVFRFLGVAPGARRQGKATAALSDVMQAADLAGNTVYIEPTSLDQDGPKTPQLVDFYKRFGFTPATEGSDKVLVREPQADEDGRPGNFLMNIEKPKKLPPGRTPELAEAAKRLKAGEITKEDFDALVNKYRPVVTYDAPLQPATDEQVFNALDVAKRTKINPPIAAGYPVGLRLDIPAYNRGGVFVVSIHEKRTPSSPGKVIGYSSVAEIKNVTFGLGNQKAALDIAMGKGKDAIQTMEGSFVPTTPAEALAKARSAFKSGDYVQVGIDPTRHAYFFDRANTQPVIYADEILQIGNMILGKGVRYGNKKDFLYNVEPSLAEQDEGDFIFGSDKIREEQIKEYAALRAKLARIPKKVAEGEVDLSMQRSVARLMQQARDLNVMIKATKPRLDSAEKFLAKAAIEFDKGNISEDVFKVIKAAYDKRPELLEGLLLSVKAEEGSKRATGQFAAFSRVVRLFKGTSGTTDPTTFQHELAHSLEQMMLPEQRSVVAQAWVKGLLKAIKNNPDEKHQKYFQAVMDFIDNPNNTTSRKALDLLPSYDMYQFLNPSEFWAVNAQNLMAAELGTAWDKFKRAIARLWEGVKSVFGFDNRYAVQKMFKDVMNGSKERITTDVLADFVNNAGVKSKVLENIEDDKNLLEKYNRPNTPQLDSSPLITQIVNVGKLSKDFFVAAVSDPLEALGTAANSVDRAILFARIKNIFFGAGVNAADFARYNGELVTSQGLATSSVALDNAIRGGQIATEVIFQGGIDFNQKSRNFVAVKRDKGMAGVYEAEIALKKRLGDQLGTDIIQGYLEAKRSRSIQNEYFAREVEYEFFENDYNELQAANAPEEDIMAARDAMVEAKDSLKAIELVYKKIRMSDEEIDEFIARDAVHPELRKIMDNWSAINQNMLAFWRQVGLLSEKRYENLSNIKDYVPWQRIMNDETDVHSPAQTTNRKMTNIGLEKLFKKGVPTVITDVVAKEGQQTFKIQPATVLEVEINGDPVAQDKITATADGQVKLDVAVTEGDLVVFKASREIENIIDNMTRNVMRMTMNGLRQGAAQRIVMEYATRDKKGKIMMFPKADKARGRFDFVVNGKRVVVEIQDPLIAESIFGMESLDIAMLAPLAAVANFTRRTITLSGVFQLKQVFKDAPTAALVTGVKRPLLLMGGIYKGFVTSLRNTDPTVQILKSAGIGGFQSAARTPEAEVKRRLGIMNRNVFDFVIKGLDHIGDASDMAQRVGVYKRVLAETGNETQALYQAANVINFLHHGSGQVAQAIVKTVPFAGAYANSMDVLIQALAGGGLKGRSRANALARLAATGTLLMGISLLYCFLVGDDEEYNQMDDQTKLRNFMIPGTKILLPMNTSAAYFFKAVPEMIYNKIIKEGTNNAVDERRLRTALKEAAIDMLLGPTPVPSGAKQVLEIGLNKDFFTGRPVVPESLAKLEAAERYTTETSEAGKFLSGLTGTKEKRILDPMEADHLIRGIFGTAGAMAQWFSNSIAVSSGDRPAMTDKQQPITGSFLRADVGRRNEDLFYDFKEEVDKRYGTYSKMLEREDDKAADAYEEKHSDILDFYKDVNKMDSELKKINAEIRYYGEGKDTGLTPVQRREEIKLLQLEKQEMLDDIIEMRKEAGM